LSNPKENLDVSIWRGDASGGKLVRYQVPREESQTILDIVYYVQRYLDPKLSYRYACRVGMCGSCAMMVNGKPRWTCRTHVQTVLDGNKVTIEPLRNLPVIKDLACDMSEFFDKWRKAEAVFHPTKTRDDEIELISPDSPKRQAAAAAIECINCAVCYAACDVVEMNPKYLGPAALNRAWTLVNDQRDGGQIERLRAVAGDAGCHNCHSQQGCMTYCPNELNPTLSIAGLKRVTAMAALKGKI
jgi:fumarate reductase iron-sulfur subunit